MESIQIQIGNRAYPLTVPADEVAQVQAAAAQVNENLNAFREQYGVDDPVDLLAMTALQSATKALDVAKAAEATPAPELLSEEEASRVANLLQRMQAASGS